MSPLSNFPFSESVLSDAQSTQSMINPGIKLPGKQASEVMKKMMERRFMEAVSRIDEHIKFLYQYDRHRTITDVTAITDLTVSLMNISNSTPISSEHHGEMLRKHPVETLTESVADALVLGQLGHADKSSIREAIFSRLGPRFATLFQIAQENVVTLESAIKTHLADVNRLLAEDVVNLNSKSLASFYRLRSFIFDKILEHKSS
ncbi:hypothetical protein PoB_004370600 [Plakobranchus ocellatus]|uniref:Uncharacterized protein n=1 Tax=Plakobranchus ocellatus TaxID=259542 RepID=A0AAV4B1E3_9GAST|nr:hypothetical protein PoB_004370600 [Plakobranchus ocellatus]